MRNDNAAWYYQQPKSAAAEIKDQSRFGRAFGWTLRARPLGGASTVAGWGAHVRPYKGLVADQLLLTGFIWLVRF